MKKLLLGAVLATLAVPLAAQNAASGSPRVQGTPDGYGDPVQVTIVAANGSDVSGTPVTGTVAIDQTTPGTTNGVALKQIGSTTVATGNGVVSAGVQRVAIASDQTAFSVLPGGNVASGAADSGNPIKVGGVTATSASSVGAGKRMDLPMTGYGLPVVTVMGQASTTPADTVTVDAFFGDVSNFASYGVLGVGGYVWNGTNRTAERQIANGTNSVGTGIAAAGLLAQGDDASIQAITENSFGNLRQSLDNHLLLASTASVVPYSAILHTQAVQIRGASGNVANGNAVATLTGTATTTVYISGFTCTMGGATAAAEVDIAITGTLGGTLTYTQGAPLGAGVPPSVINVNFSPAYPASAVNTTIVVTQPAGGTGNAHSACVSTGFYM